MAHSFVPFSPTPVTPETVAEKGARFSPMNAAPSSMPENKAPAASAASAAQVPCASAPAAKPQISLTRENDRITRITIRCGCGEVTELDCEY